jgi:hypothetical protein
MKPVGASTDTNCLGSAFDCESTSQGGERLWAKGELLFDTH